MFALFEVRSISNEINFYLTFGSPNDCLQNFLILSGLNNMSYFGGQFGLSDDVLGKFEEINESLSSELERSDVEEFNLTAFPLGAFRCVQFADKPEEIDRMKQIVWTAKSVYPRALKHSEKELEALFVYLRDNCNPEMYGANVYEDGYIEYCDIEYAGEAFSKTRDVLADFSVL